MSNPNPNPNYDIVSDIRSTVGPTGGSSRSLAALVDDYFELASDEIVTVESLAEFSKEVPLGQEIKGKMEDLMSKMFQLEENYDNFLAGTGSAELPKLASSDDRIIELSQLYNVPNDSGGTNLSMMGYRLRERVADPHPNYPPDDFDDDGLQDVEIDEGSINSITTDSRHDEVDTDGTPTGRSYIKLVFTSGTVYSNIDTVDFMNFSGHRIRIVDSNGGAFNGDYEFDSETSSQTATAIQVYDNGTDFPSNINTFTYNLIRIEQDFDDDNDGIADDVDPNDDNLPYLHSGTIQLKYIRSSTDYSPQKIFWTSGFDQDLQPSGVPSPENGGSLGTEGSTTAGLLDGATQNKINAQTITGVPTAEEASTPFFTGDGFNVFSDERTGNAISTVGTWHDLDFAHKFRNVVIGAPVRIVRGNPNDANYTYDGVPFASTTRADGISTQVSVSLSPNYHYLNDWFIDALTTLNTRFSEIEARLAGLVTPLMIGTKGIKWSHIIGDPKGTLNSVLATASKSGNSKVNALGNVYATNTDDVNDYALAMMNVENQNSIGKLNDLNSKLDATLANVNSYIDQLDYPNTDPTVSELEEEVNHLVGGTTTRFYTP
tara:strand:+ start:116 stop:1921 length:1806 start_codon:yes stop_codon:yes gene_type:complete